MADEDFNDIDMGCCGHKVIYCDVKHENILLHEHFQPMTCDFGLSKLLNPKQVSHFTTMRGARGNLAPECLTSSVISKKTDVYSYGMVLLELVRGIPGFIPLDGLTYHVLIKGSS